ncbi:hypothetical protein [Rickettsiales endosymbiont of Stachyamoeba lipophora]|uniref:hypothetical protein n=1 Tax=Rickettsiales endosymbiont of Stachyamoeba lipophora TaxID=2486578 RepID=UPI000F645445|nr:hypothetical protein [Rickettsiales endosymbiont of Stachyamoeba lipophora]AZL15681.1 hypothetical protein EF513_03840 [Rickettsiales endosymbiont of Stachyamoeba lipophora]
MSKKTDSQQVNFSELLTSMNDVKKIQAIRNEITFSHQQSIKTAAAEGTQKPIYKDLTLKIGNVKLTLNFEQQEAFKKEAGARIDAIREGKTQQAPKQEKKEQLQQKQQTAQVPKASEIDKQAITIKSDLAKFINPQQVQAQMQKQEKQAIREGKLEAAYKSLEAGINKIIWAKPQAPQPQEMVNSIRIPGNTAKDEHKKKEAPVASINKSATTLKAIGDISKGLKGVLSIAISDVTEKLTQIRNKEQNQGRSGRKNVNLFK